MKMVNQFCFVSLYFIAFIFASNGVFAQPPRAYSSSEIRLMLKKLNVLGTVLYLAAHPDDENTKLITYFAKKENLDVAYLSLTRGDGGQNLVGTDKGSLLGVIRTQELLAARRLDGAQQFFTRANDFGYSKTSTETLTMWDEEDILADVVFMIRKIKPDVIVTRFPPLKYNYPTHGHHTASAYLAEKAFDLAGDPTAFPNQLELVDVWQPKRLYWNTSSWFYKRTGTELDVTDKIQIDVGAYLPELGISCTEIAAESRSQHKSQGFGAAKSRGTQIEYLEHVKGDVAATDIFEGIDRSWNRIEGRNKVKELISRAYRDFDAHEPAAVLPELLEASTLLKAHNDFWSTKKRKELQRVIAALTGLFLEVVADDFSATPNSDVHLTATAINRSDVKIEWTDLGFSIIDEKTPVPLAASDNAAADNTLLFNNPHVKKITLTVPASTPITQPYWLIRKPKGLGMYHVEDPSSIGLSEAPADLYAMFELRINGVDFDYDIPIQYKWTDRVRGELYRPLIVAPAVTVTPKQKVVILTDMKPREVTFQVKAWEDNVSGELILNLPPEWSSEPEIMEVAMTSKGEERYVSFDLFPSKGATQFDLTLVFRSSKGNSNKSAVEIAYDHIPIQNLWPEALTRVVKLDIRTSGGLIGYVQGPGDEVAENLQQIGYRIEFLNEDKIVEMELADFDAIMIGIRAYNTEEWLVHRHKKLMEYVKKGGNLIVQYQTTRGLLTDEIGPYPFKIGKDRVTVETARMEMIDPGHSIFNKPNKLTEDDFSNWVQERGLYFASEWDDRYVPLFSCHDPDEDPVKGSLLVTEYGEGVFVYTGISFFRQLPAGVPGSFRLLANILAHEN